ncbi:MAG: FixH family protein [Gammaproteobacteria bacterium]
MTLRVLWLAFAVATTSAHAQPPRDDFGFLERWQILSEQFRLGKLAVTEQGMPVGFDTLLSKPTEERHFNVSIGAEHSSVPFNRIHAWRVHIKTPAGKPVEGAALSFFGGMPLHNHGFPTEPLLAGELAPGTYRLEGVKFSMGGWWTLALGVVANDLSDRVSFNLVIDP